MGEIWLQIEMDSSLLSGEKQSSSSKSVYLQHNPEGVPLVLLLLFNTTSIISLSFKLRILLK
jgi:hypothetical protein